jgi:archaellum component FlaD/FlaE
VPPQLPSVETFPGATTEDDAAGAEETVEEREELETLDELAMLEELVIGEEVEVRAAGVVVDDVRAELDDVRTDETEDVRTEETEDVRTEEREDDRVDVDETRTEVTDDVQSPNPVWHPAPQYADVEPQWPLLEQQFPNAEFLQVSVFQDCVPQRAVVLTLRACAGRRGRAAKASRRIECMVSENRRNE